MSTYTATTVPTQFVEANGIRFGYRRWGKRIGLPLVFNQHFTGNLDNWDPAVLDGLAKEREVIIFNNAGVASSTGEVPTSFAGMAKNAAAFFDGLGLTKVDLLGFSIGGMVAQQITLDRPELVRKLILVGTAPRNHDAGNGQGHITPETAAIFGATYDPPENLWLKVFFTDSENVYTVNSLYLVQNMPNAKLILYADANHGSWYENHEDFVFETNRFLNESDRIATVTTSTADD